MSAYEIIEGVTAEEAAELGLIVVEEKVHGARRTPVYGRYFEPGEEPKVAAAEPDPLDHDGDGKKGGSKPRAAKAAD